MHHSNSKKTVYVRDSQNISTLCCNERVCKDSLHNACEHNLWYTQSARFGARFDAQFSYPGYVGNAMSA